MTATLLTRTTAAIVILALLAVVASAMFVPRRPSGLVIITLDTTRADRLPVYGFGSVAAPAIEELAARGAVFDEAVSVAPLTLPAHTSLLTGLYPPRHGVRDNADRPLEPSHVTLASILHARGFQTAAFVGSIVLGADRGLSGGFDVYDDGRTANLAPLRRPGSEIVDRALEWIDGLSRKRPFFLWVHLYDVHAPQALPMEFRRTYGDRYEAGIAYEDQQIARLIDALTRRRLMSKTVVVVVGDHGESLGEHGENEHGIFLYQSTLHVPLILSAPGVTARRVVGPASLVDIAPTVLELLGVPAFANLDGISLVPALTSGRTSSRPIYAESLYAAHFGWGALRMVRDGRFKFIDGPKPELYDLEADLLESHNIADGHVTTTAALRRELTDMTLNMPSHSDAVPMSLDTRRALSALGYLGR